MRCYLVVLAAVLPAAAIAQVVPPIIDGSPMVVAQELYVWQIESLTCGGAAVRAVLPPEPLGELHFALRTASRAPVRFSFAIDQSGRPVDIVGPPGDYQAQSDDLGPALAASRFAPGEARSRCEAVFAAEHAPWADSPVADVMRYTVFPSQRPPRDAFDRVKPAGSTCFDPTPAVLTRSYPDFKTIPQPPGTLSWTMIGYDTDAGGKPVRVKRVAGSGNAALDAKAVAAVRQSRFEAGARQGCLYPYWRRGGNMTAPEIPIAKDYRPTGSTCPEKANWVKPPVYRYPENYRRRDIEGWAVVQYDVAPWGQVGNPRILAAEPAAVFGDAAKAVLAGATRAPSSGYVGCVDRVRFVLETPRTAPGGSVITTD